MNGAPVTNDDSNQQKQADKQQPAGLGGVHSVALMLVGWIFLLRFGHERILRREEIRYPIFDSAVPRLDILESRSFQIPPVQPHAHFHQQGDGKCVHFFHVVANQCPHDVNFVLGNFEH